MNMAKGVAAGAVDFKGWFIVVALAAGALQWPRRCACCLRRPETTGAAEKDGQVIVRYPMCRRCFRHAKKDDIAMGVSLAIGVLTIGGGWIALFGFSIMVWIGLQIVLMLFAVVLVTGAVYWLIGLFVGTKLARCPDEGWPVELYTSAGVGDVLGKDAERTDEKNLRLWCTQAAEQLGAGAYALQLRNYDYAREFIKVNGGDPARLQTIQEAY